MKLPLILTSKSMGFKTLTISVLVTAMALTGCSKEERDNALSKASDALELDHKDVFELKMGACFNNPDSSDVVMIDEETESVSEIPIRECTEPHDNEVFYTFDLPDAEVMDTSPESEDLIYNSCHDAFVEFIGIAYDDSIYDMGYYAPSPETWVTGDHEVLCYVYHPDKQVTQSLKGAQE